jgi:hypothetical protein
MTHTKNTQDTSQAAVAAWFGQRLPQEWTAPSTQAPTITVDREEITVILALAAPETAPGDGEVEAAQAAAGLVARFRSETRDQRIAIAREAEHRFGRKVSWGVQVADTRELFTHLAIPVMTRLRQPERQVLDTLVAAGVARSRAHALAWCVRLVGENTESWLSDLRSAMENVATVRAAGPAGSAASAAQEDGDADGESSGDTA